MPAIRRHFSPSEKLRAIKRVQAKRGGTSVAEACENAGIRRDDYYRWFRKYRSGGEEALAQVSRRPKKLARSTPEALKSKVRAMAKSRRYANPTKICEDLRASGSNITPKTVIAILEEAGLYRFISQARKGGLEAKRKGIVNSPK